MTIIDSRRSARFFNIDKNPANPASAPTWGNAKDSCAIGQIEAIGPSALVKRISTLYTVLMSSILPIRPPRNAPPRQREKPPLRASRILDQLRERIRYFHYALSTERAYVYWARDFIRWHGVRHPSTMGAAEVEAYLTHLANARGVSASTHNQALSALLFLYRDVLDVDLPWLSDIGRPAQRQRLPVILTVDEVQRLLDLLPQDVSLIGRLLFGTGMRLMEGLRLRVKDVDFAHRAIVVREGKGGKDRVVMLPDALAVPLRQQLDKSRALWQADRDAGRPGVEMPDALARKYPRAAESWSWHWVFPAPGISTDPRSGIRRRHHLFEQRLQRGIRRAAQEPVSSFVCEA